MNKKEFLNLINQHRKDERHHAQVEKFINKLPSTSMLSGWIPYTDLKYDTLYLASEHRPTPRVYYLYVPSGQNRPSDSIRMYWILISEFEEDNKIGFSSYPRTGTSWMGQLEEITDFPTQFLNWKGEPWEGEK